MVHKLAIDEINTQLFNGFARSLVVFLCNQFDAQTQIPVLEEASEQLHGRVSFFIVYIDNIHAVAESFNIKGTPTIIAYENGREKGRLLGKIEREKLALFIQRIVSS